MEILEQPIIRKNVIQNKNEYIRVYIHKLYVGKFSLIIQQVNYDSTNLSNRFQ